MAAFLEVDRVLNAYTSDGIARAAGSALQRNADALTRGLFRALKKDAIPATRMRTANFKLASLAQAAIVNGWRARLPVPGGAPGYRAGPDPDHDRLSGALGHALKSDSMIHHTTSYSISFLNTDVLWREARHWHRVNYGAKGPKASQKQPRAWPVNIDGHTIAVLQDPGKPDKNSWLPRRYIAKNPEYFSPVRLKGPLVNKADVPGGGHRSALFSEIGFRSLVVNLEHEYRDMLDEWIREEGAEAVRRSLYARGVRIPVHVLLGG